MVDNFFLVNIKEVIILVKLFPNCGYNDGVLTNHNGFELYGEPFIMSQRGPNHDEFHVMMSWAVHNVSPIGIVEGHLDVNTEKLIIYNEQYSKMLENMTCYEVDSVKQVE
jgi:hypothetical protein